MTPDLPPWDVMLARKVAGLTPEQLSVTYWAPGAYLISWTTGTEQVGPLHCCEGFLLDQATYCQWLGIQCS
jgi:hypothetical protein